MSIMEASSVPFGAEIMMSAAISIVYRAFLLSLELGLWVNPTGSTYKYIVSPGAKVFALDTFEMLASLCTPDALETLCTPDALETLCTPDALETLCTPDALETLDKLDTRSS